MRRAPALLGALALAAVAADFPPPDALPSHPGLPDPLVMLDGTKVTSKEQWEAKRRPELRALFEHYMYGRTPPTPAAVTAKVLFEDAKAFGGKGTLREVELTTGPAGWPTIYVLVAVPNGAKGPVPCLFGPNFQANHVLVADERVRVSTAPWQYPKSPGLVDGKATAAGRGKVLDVWPFEQALDRGYAVATFYAGDVQPDRPNVREGMRTVLPQPEGKPVGDETATVASWAWGTSRVVDHLLTDKGIDGKRLAVVGHSRLGKTALLAGAFDDRIAVVIPSQAGVGGSGPSRHADPMAESAKKITTTFPHWFCGNYVKLAADPSKLPFDQNGLVALCAPRPVLFSNAADDLWANPSGQFEVLKAAAPVYKLLGVEGVGSDSPPPAGELLASRLGYFVRPGKHSMTPVDWKAYLDFADKWMK